MKKILTIIMLMLVLIGCGDSSDTLRLDAYYEYVDRMVGQPEVLNIYIAEPVECDENIQQTLQKVKSANSWNWISEDDWVQYGVIDYWANPWENTVVLEELPNIIYNKGDCEDYALKMYFLLANMNIESRLIWVGYNDTNTKTHIALESCGYVIDNQAVEVLTIEESMKQGNYYIKAVMRDTFLASDWDYY